MIRTSRHRRLLWPVALLALAGCSGPQSALDPAGVEAEEIATLFWQMLAGAGVIWTLVLGTAIYASRSDQRLWSERRALNMILWAGAIVPTLVLAGLLAHGLRLMPLLRAEGSDLRIEVAGERFWWRVTYLRDGLPSVVTANELRLPAGADVEVVLTTTDIIHSFWIPSISGKTDMIPGRTNRQMLRPTRPGIYRGACAEFCGSSHALMAMSAEVMAPDAFARWLEAEARPAVPSGARGEQVFLQNGCGACHAVRGISDGAAIGPDLTHLGSRHTVGAGILDNTPENIAHFVAHTEALKPGVRMPPYDMLPEDDLVALATWLGSLR
ncbi:cytochrome c oxidase subunit II [Geminicoccus roseus]|uniref:cytochrome c oxidase subunit II n=1 Tax=Geminicoccus roseus TaxID=404900 RepID=UPI00042A5BF9|nr:cytochrome c oxidase subunit II [Geminicoccus roseus]